MSSAQNTVNLNNAPAPYRRRVRNHRVIPGFGLTMGITLSMLSVFILIPLASVLVYSFHLEPSQFIDLITRENVLNAFKVTILCALIAALINSVFGVILAWVLVRYDFPGKRILDGLIELPFALPTAVAGITLSKMYSTTGEIGEPLSSIGLKVSYTHLGMIIALVFIGIPFVVRAIQPVLTKLNPQYEEAARMLGAGRIRTFFTVILSELRPAILTGFGLAFARGIGEYGSVIYISGNSAKNQTQVVSYVIMQKLNYVDYASATAIALVMLIISFTVLLLLNFVQVRQSSRTGGDDGAGGAAVSRKAASSEEGRGAAVALIILAVIFILIMLVLPLLSVIRNSLSLGLGFYLQSLTTDYVRSALKVTVLATIAALICNTFFGIVCAWTLTKFSFRGKQFISTVIDIPFSISPVIAGLAFIMLFGRMGWAAPLLDWIYETTGMDIQIVFAIPGVLLATIFVTFPFVSREVIPVLNAQGRDEEEAAALMGARGWNIFWHITFPQMKWALLYGIILCTARALGEFGAVNALSKTRGETFTLPLEIDALYLGGTADSIVSAFSVSSILVIIAVATLILRSVLEYRHRDSIA